MTAATEQPRDFDGATFDFAVGEVYGMRAWQTDDYGRLRACNLTGAGTGVAPWRPGINTARCYRLNPEKASGGIVIGPGGFFAAGGLVIGGTPTATFVENTEHAAPHEGCGCGFYAYTVPGQHLAVAEGSGLVLGVIRGTGRTLIGAKGFRCEKAEIVALLDPAAGERPPRWAVWQREQLQRNYPEVPLLPTSEALRQCAPIESTAPAPGSDEFWDLP